jgi:hypothetical protein
MRLCCVTPGIVPQRIAIHMDARRHKTIHSGMQYFLNRWECCLFVSADFDSVLEEFSG